MSVPRSPQQLNIRVRDNRRIEFFMLPNDLIDLHTAELGPYASIAYVALCRYAGTDQATISYTTLAHRLGMARSTLALALNQLRCLKYVTVEHTRTAKGRGVNIYTIERLPVSPSAGLTSKSATRTNPSPADGLTLVRQTDYLKDHLEKDTNLKEEHPNLKRIREQSTRLRQQHKRSR
jgi:hypothetical protein